jgi:hypothetical protein
LFFAKAIIMICKLLAVWLLTVKVYFNSLTLRKVLYGSDRYAA